MRNTPLPSGRSQSLRCSILTLFFTACFALALPPELRAADEPAVTRGPYLQMGTSSSMVVRWRTSISTDSSVCFGTDPNNLSRCVDLGDKTTEHIVALSGLTADTRYYYSVGTTMQRLAGGDANHFFVSSPASGSAQPTRIWVIGDSGTADAGARAVRDAYLHFAGSQHTDLWLMLGDNAYDDGTDSEYQAAVFDMYPSLLRQTPLWPTLGNHDGVSANSSTQTGPYYAIFTLPKLGEAGGISSGTEAYYSFDFGNIHFIVLDSFETDRSPASDMMTWLQSDLASNTKPWIIAFWHHPPYSRFAEEEMRLNALPILEAGGVDLVLTGHSHSYQRSFFIDGHYGTSGTFSDSMKRDGGDGRSDGTGEYQKSALAPVPNEGTVYVVAGSSGSVSSVSLNDPAMFTSLNFLGSMVLDVNGNRLDAIFLDSNRVTRDYFSIVKGTGSPALATVTISSPDASATEAGPTTGSFLVRRTGSTTTPLAVSYTISGTATNGADYSFLPDNITIPAGSSTGTLTVTPFEDSLVEANETVIVTIVADVAYAVGAADSATITITDNPLTNQSPGVNAGPDQTITQPATVSLNATVSDDGFPEPPGQVTVTWTKVSGPGSVIFSDASSVNTTASFSKSGAYVLRLTANDGALSSSDDVKIKVEQPDLVVASLSLSSKQVASGSTISVTDTTKNTGTGLAAASTIKFYLSNNKTFEVADLELGSRVVPSLAAGAKTSAVTSVTIPSGMAAGNYYVFGVADAGAVVSEAKEDNNIQFKALAIN